MSWYIKQVVYWAVVVFAWSGALGIFYLAFASEDHVIASVRLFLAFVLSFLAFEFTRYTIHRFQ